MEWFKKVGWTYLPISIMGWIVSLVTIGLCIWVFIFTDRHSHSVSDTLIGCFPYIVCFLVVFGWIASNTSKTTTE